MLVARRQRAMNLSFHRERTSCLQNYSIEVFDARFCGRVVMDELLLPFFASTCDFATMPTFKLKTIHAWDQTILLYLNFVKWTPNEWMISFQFLLSFCCNKRQQMSMKLCDGCFSLFVIIFLFSTSILRHNTNYHATKNIKHKSSITNRPS